MTCGGREQHPPAQCGCVSDRRLCHLARHPVLGAVCRHRGRVFAGARTGSDRPGVRGAGAGLCHALSCRRGVSAAGPAAAQARALDGLAARRARSGFGRHRGLAAVRSGGVIRRAGGARRRVRAHPRARAARAEAMARAAGIRGAARLGNLGGVGGGRGVVAGLCRRRERGRRDGWPLAPTSIRTRSRNWSARARPCLST